MYINDLYTEELLVNLFRKLKKKSIVYSSD